MRKALPFALLVALPVAVVVMHLVSIPVYSDAGRRMLDSLHAPVFGLLAVGLLLGLKGRLRPLPAYAIAAGATFLLGVVGEIVQYFGPRNADLADLLRDAIGIGGFLGMYATVDPAVRKIGNARRFAVAGLAAVLLVVALWPVGWYGYAFIARHAASPALLTFESNWESEFFHNQDYSTVSVVEQPAGWPLPEQRRLAAVTFSGEEYPGFALHPRPDWRSYTHFSFVVAAPASEASGFTVRIHDAHHDQDADDRFNRDFTASPVPRRLAFALEDVFETPGGRRMDPAAIATVIIFATGEGRDKELLLDDFRLERRP